MILPLFNTLINQFSLWEKRYITKDQIKMIILSEIQLIIFELFCHVDNPLINDSVNRNLVEVTLKIELES